MGTAIFETTIGQAVTALESGEYRVRELVEAYLGRAEQVDQAGTSLNSLVTVADSCLMRADELDSLLADTGELVGPLHGVPVVVKDQIETAGIATSFGSEAFRDYVPVSDATVVKKLRAAGAIILGKSSMPDFATSWFSKSSRNGVTHNPYDVRRDSGGSSGGSAVAVAANIALAGVGGDTGGSIRLPASFSNVVGVRPTPGLISRAGMSCFIAPQDTAGPVARTVLDAAKLLDVMVGFDAHDGGSSLYGAPRHASAVTRYEESSPRVGVLTQLRAIETTPAGARVNQLLDESANALATAGLTVVEIEIDGLSELLEESTILQSRAHGDINSFLASRPGIAANTLADVAKHSNVEKWPILLRAILDFPREHSEDPSYSRRIRARSELYQRVGAAMDRERLQAFIYPSAQLPAPSPAEIETGTWEQSQSLLNTLLASQLLLPAMSVPAGFTKTGLPIGIDIMGRPLTEPQMLIIARYLEVGLRARKPPLTLPKFVS